ncbi:MAG: type II toxin-antitoxin system RelE/ParE family toxin [Terriglobia bacterium]
MKSRIILRPAADRDVVDQAEYLTRHQSLQTGLRFYRATEETFRLLASQPEMGTRAECRSSFLNGMRMFPVKRFPKHLVFYRCVENGIEVIRVLHGARNIEALFERRAEGGEDSRTGDRDGEVSS